MPLLTKIVSGFFIFFTVLSVAVPSVYAQTASSTVPQPDQIQEQGAEKDSFAVEPDNTLIPSVETEPARFRPVRTFFERMRARRARFHVTASLVNEYEHYKDDSYLNYTKYKQTWPLLNNKTAFRVTIPYVATDRTKEEHGLGDIELRLTGVLYSKDRLGFGVGTDLSFDTAVEEALGRGFATLAPFASVSVILTDRWRIEPTTKYRFGTGGDQDHYRKQTTNLYINWKGARNQAYVQIDPEICTNYETEKTSVTLGVEVGRRLRPQTTVFFKPVLPLDKSTSKKPFQWKIEAGIKKVY